MLPHDVALSDKAPLWSPAVFIAKFAPIVGPGHQHYMADAVAFLSYPRNARLERDLTNRLAKSTTTIMTLKSSTVHPFLPAFSNGRIHDQYDERFSDLLNSPHSFQ
ncbi:hypothetical protein TNCV_4617871 [Trichonephila clavipes]|nr:hypothetical protein TNCV_4617871 [Trichonephila clavipes]